MTKDKTSYDLLHYDALPQKQGNLRALETVADLFGIEPVDIRQCRVLELGTGTGKTLICQAEEFPESEFIGVDLSEEQIKDGLCIVEEIGLKNIRLLCQNIMEIGADWGTFDYIIVHGTYSWVPAVVQEKILEICRENLSSSGIAMISYNTYPGWHAKELVRKLMVFHTREARSLESPEAEVREAKSVLDDFAVMKSQQGGFDAPVYEHLRKQMAAYDEDYIFHEYLEDDNFPCYFVDFHKRLKEHGLDHLSDFDWRYIGTCLLQTDLRRFVEDIRSTKDLEQYLDFFVNRPFRASIVTHESTAVLAKLRTNIVDRYVLSVPEQFAIERTDANIWKLGSITPDSVTVTFRLESTPFHDALIAWLDRNRLTYFTIAELENRLLRTASPSVPTQHDSAVFRSTMTSLVRLGLLDMTLRPAPSGISDPDRPQVRAFARSLARRGYSIIPNPEFGCLALDPLTAFLVPLLDGSHRVSELVDFSQQELNSGRITLADRSEKYEMLSRGRIEERVRQCLNKLRDYRLIS